MGVPKSSFERELLLLLVYHSLINHHANFELLEAVDGKECAFRARKNGSKRRAKVTAEKGRLHKINPKSCFSS